MDSNQSGSTKTLYPTTTVIILLSLIVSAISHFLPWVGTNFPMAGYLRGIKESVGLISFVLVLSALLFYLGNKISKKFSFKYDKIVNAIIMGLAVFFQLLFLLKFYRYINNQLQWMGEVSEKYGTFGFNSFMYGFYISLLTTLVAAGVMIWVIVNKKESISD